MVVKPAGPELAGGERRDAQPVEVPGGALDDAAARRSVACFKLLNR